MSYFDKGFRIINKTEIKIFCISIYLSASMDKVNIAFLVLLSGTKPNCSCDISGLRPLRIIAIIILRSTLVKWLIKLIVLYSSQSIVPGILGRVN